MLSLENVKQKYFVDLNDDRRSIHVDVVAVCQNYFDGIERARLLFAVIFLEPYTKYMYSASFCLEVSSLCPILQCQLMTKAIMAIGQRILGDATAYMLMLRTGMKYGFRDMNFAPGQGGFCECVHRGSSHYILEFPAPISMHEFL